MTNICFNKKILNVASDLKVETPFGLNIIGIIYKIKMIIYELFIVQC
jgi:hypothetical protein